MPSPTLAQLADALREGRVTSSALVDEALAAAAAEGGEGRYVFIKQRAEAARAEARAADARRRAGRALGPLDGVPISIKDVFDVVGEVTTAGSRALLGSPPATRHADVVERLFAAGAVVVGRTNMSEFAYSGLGLNPHYGTPASPWRRDERRVSGGSSSGAAVSVSDGYCAAAIGTDTGGSVRTPAACCGLTGFKPTARRIPTRGSVPLSPTLDSVGPIARSVSCCAMLDAVMAGEPHTTIAARAESGITLGVARDFFLADAEPEVAATFERAISRLAAAGVRMIDVELRALHRLPEINRAGGFVAVEAWAWHKDLLRTRAADYDPRVARRIERGEALQQDEPERLRRERRALIDEVSPSVASVDAVVTLTIPIAPPRIAELEADEKANKRANALMVRSPSVVNFIDGCALSLPCHDEGEAPVGLMLFAGTLRDAHLLTVGAAVERCLAEKRRR